MAAISSSSFQWNDTLFGGELVNFHFLPSLEFKSVLECPLKDIWGHLCVILVVCCHDDRLTVTSVLVTQVSAPLSRCLLPRGSPVARLWHLPLSQSRWLTLVLSGGRSFFKGRVLMFSEKSFWSYWTSSPCKVASLSFAGLSLFFATLILNPWISACRLAGGNKIPFAWFLAFCYSNLKKSSSIFLKCFHLI